MEHPNKFYGTMEIKSAVSNSSRFQTSEWEYDPKKEKWYADGRDYPVFLCRVVEVISKGDKRE